MGAVFSSAAPGKNGKPANSSTTPNTTKAPNASASVAAPVTGGKKKRSKTRKSARHYY
jgi:hypothetical protein